MGVWLRGGRGDGRLRRGRVVGIGRDVRYAVEVEFCGWNGGGLGWRLAIKRRFIEVVSSV